MEWRAQALLDLGHPEAVITTLETETLDTEILETEILEDPYRERLRHLLAQALHRDRAAPPTPSTSSATPGGGCPTTSALDPGPELRALEEGSCAADRAPHHRPAPRRPSEAGTGN